MDIHERLVIARRAAGFKSASAAAAANRWQIPTYSAHENGGRKPREAVIKYAKAFGVTLEWLQDGRGEMRGNATLQKPVPQQIDFVDLPKIPLIGRAGAGVFVRNDDGFVDEFDMIEGGKHPKFPRAKHFAVTVEGDSMNNMGAESLNHGDIAFCVAWADTGYMPIDGYLVVAEQRTNGGHIKERTLKEIKIVDGGISLEPRSTNPKHKPIFIARKESDDGCEIEIIGLVYGLNRVFNRRI